MSIDHAPARLLAGLWDHDLRRGAGDRPERGACLLEAACWIAHGCMSDAPPCVCPVIGLYAITLNDVLPDAPRQRLRQYLLLLNGTRDAKSESDRAVALVSHLSRALLPVALRASGFDQDAEWVADAPTGIREICVAYDSGWDGLATTYLHKAWICAPELPDEAVRCGAHAMGLLLEQLEEAGHDAAISGLDAMLAIGGRADPPDAAKVAAAAESFARARLVALSGAAA